MNVAGLHHIALNVDDLDAATHFYVDQLGFPLLDRPPFDFPGAWLQAGEHQVHLMVMPGFEADRRQHFALRVDDLDAEVASLEAAGVEVFRAAEVAGAGRQAFLRDPSGNRIELNEPS
jgi:catechol 2,3-dioxygenase-like lactoylglutathione lyase family enzyme